MNMTSVLKNTSIILGSALAAFAVAVVGALFVLPMVAPNAVSDLSADSTQAADSTALASASPADSLGGVSADSSRSRADSASTLAALRDSLSTLRDQLESTQATTTSLRSQTDSLRSALAAAETQQVQTEDLSSALLNMERRELAALLGKVEMDVLRTLYGEATGRSRTRLLQAMTPDRAAQFVNQMVVGSTTTPSASDTAPQTVPPSE
jgi:septal ring factor EnvC (AmiA/AmiB activator)